MQKHVSVLEKEKILRDTNGLPNSCVKTRISVNQQEVI